MFCAQAFPMACARNTMRSRLGVATGNGIVPRLQSQGALTSPRLQYPLATRPFTTEKISPGKKDEILIKQRRNRPVSPHLGAYDIKQTWLGSSAWMRITGLTLSGGLYAFFAAHLLAPAFGAQFGSDQLVAAFASLSPTVQGACKFAMAFPFVFHGLNGIKQLMFDMGIGYPKKVIVYADPVQWTLSLLGAAYLAFWF